MPRYQRIFDRRGAPLREIQVVGVAADVVRVAFHVQLPRRVLDERVGISVSTGSDSGFIAALAVSK